MQLLGGKLDDYRCQSLFITCSNSAVQTRRIPGVRDVAVTARISFFCGKAEAEIAEFRRFQSLISKLVEVNRTVCRLRPLEQTEQTPQEKNGRNDPTGSRPRSRSVVACDLPGSVQDRPPRRWVRVRPGGREACRASPTRTQPDRYREEQQRPEKHQRITHIHAPATRKNVPTMGSTSNLPGSLRSNTADAGLFGS
jgi:hypothetical protein